MARPLTAALLALLLSGNAFAENGVGEAPRQDAEGDFRHILDGIRAPPMAALGSDAIRFSKAPALGGDGFVLTFRIEGDAARVEVVSVYGHNGLDWRRTRDWRFPITRQEYDRIAAEVDRILARGDPEDSLPVDVDGERAMFVCSDGPGYLTERNRNGSVAWMTGSCADDDPNDEIHDYLVGFVFELLIDR